MKHPYGTGADEESFTWSLFLVMTNRLVTCAVNIVLLYTFARSEMAPVAPLYKYAAVSVSNVVATYCQVRALHAPAYPPPPSACQRPAPEPAGARRDLCRPTTSHGRVLTRHLSERLRRARSTRRCAT